MPTIDKQKVLQTYRKVSGNSDEPEGIFEREAHILNNWTRVFRGKDKVSPKERFACLIQLPKIFDLTPWWKVVDEHTCLSYKKFLKSDYWKIVREYKIDQVGYRCQDCGKKKRRLQVHHTTYEHQGNEAHHPEDLEVLCPGCHKRRHSL